MSKRFQKLEAEAAAFNIKVVDGRAIELEAPDGFQFDTDLHVLVSAPWDMDTRADVVNAAFADVRNYGPRLAKCPEDCTCKD